MAARILAIADAVEATINAAYGLGVTAERAYIPTYALEDLGTTKVTVVPVGAEIENLSRSLGQFDWTIDIGVMRRFEPASFTDANLDTMLELVDDITDLFRNQPLSGTAARCVEVQNRPVYSPDHLAQLRQFTSVITLTFRGTA